MHFIGQAVFLLSKNKFAESDCGETMATALVVDDSRTVRTILGRTLKELGLEVLEAANGREALEVVAEHKSAVSLILLDWDMPEMNGLEMLKRLRETPEFSSLVVVMVTAQSEMVHVAEALDAGANEYVMKPFTKEVILGKLQLAGIEL
jgi:two-component system chemotaxis response regulator CheY